MEPPWHTEASSCWRGRCSRLCTQAQHGVPHALSLTRTQLPCCCNLQALQGSAFLSRRQTSQRASLLGSGLGSSGSCGSAYVLRSSPLPGMEITAMAATQNRAALML